MPELPEVEFAVRQLRPLVVGRRIETITAHHPSQRRTLPGRARSRIAGCRIIAVERHGKHQLLRLDDGGALLVHFRLDGDWEVASAGGDLPRHTRVSLRLSPPRVLALTDPRALCTLRYLAPGAPLGLSLGPEPEDPAFTAEHLRERLRSKRGPIKPVLLDQRLIAGVGNIYAGEACWHARIAPTVPASRLSAARVARLLDGLRRTLADGHENAGRYHRGEQRIPFEVYDREGEPCSRCGSRIKRVEQAGRGTWYCPRCQRR